MHWFSTRHVCLSLALIPGFGCPSSGNEAPGSDTGTSSGAATGSTTATSGSTATTVSDASGGSSSGSDTSDDTSATADTTDSGGSTSGDTEGIDCEARCAEQGACGGAAEENCLANCIQTQQAADWVGPSCGDAYQVLQECSTQRSCDQIEQGIGCEAELEGIAAACGPLASAACQAACVKWIQCDQEDEEACTTNCALSLGFAATQFGRACRQAIEAVYECEAELDCDADVSAACADAYPMTERACGR